MSTRIITPTEALEQLENALVLLRTNAIGQQMSKDAKAYWMFTLGMTISGMKSRPCVENPDDVYEILTSFNGTIRQLSTGAV